MATAFGLFYLSFHHWSHHPRLLPNPRSHLRHRRSNASYTIGGRTFTKANLSDLKKHLEPLAETLAEYLPAFREIHRSTAPALIGVRF